MNTFRNIVIAFSLLIACGNDDTQEPKTDYLASILSDCDRNRETFGNVDDLEVRVVFNEISGLFYFREVTGFDSQNNFYVCTVDEKFKQDGLQVFITGKLELFSDQEKEILGPVPVATELYFFKPEKIEAIK